MLCTTLLILLAQGAAADSLTGTVRSVDAQTGTIEVVTAVGYAFRVVRIAISADTSRAAIAAAQQALPVQLKPGAIVHVRYQRVGDRNVAAAIELRSTGRRP